MLISKKLQTTITSSKFSTIDILTGVSSLITACLIGKITSLVSQHATLVGHAGDGPAPRQTKCVVANCTTTIYSHLSCSTLLSVNPPPLSPSLSPPPLSPPSSPQCVPPPLQPHVSVTILYNDKYFFKKQFEKCFIYFLIVLKNILILYFGL